MKYILLLFLPIISTAQITPRNLLQKNCPVVQLKKVLLSQPGFHPFPKTPEEWKKILPDSVLRQLVKNGEEAMKQNFPNVPATTTLDFSRNGNRTRYETITFGKRNYLWNLVLAESVEGKKRFTDKILDAVWSICEESFWGTSAHLFIQKKGKGLPDVEDPVVDLFAAETAANLALVDYFIGPGLDSISPLIRRRIYYEVNRRVFVPLQTAKYEWMGYGNRNAKLNNWAPWIVSNYLTAVLLLEKDITKRTKYVTQAMLLTDQYINGIGMDGACEEGPHYWTFGAGSVLDILNLLDKASNGRINIYNETIIRNMGAYIYCTHISGNYFVDVADSHPEVYPEAVMVWRYGQDVADKTLSAFGSWLFHRTTYMATINPTFHRTRSLFDLMNLKNVSADNEVYHEVEDSWMPDVQLMTKRMSNGIFVAAHGGNNGESHNHNDVGDFIIYADGDPVIIDVGSGMYTAKTFSKDRYKLWFNTSAYHNLPTVNGQEQLEGAEHLASNVSYQKGNDQSVLDMRIEKAYGPEAALATWRRRVTAGNNRVLVVDDVMANKKVSLAQSFMTVCDVDTSQPGMIVFTTEHGKKVSMEYDKSFVVSKEVMQLSTEEELGLKSTWRNQTITRILLTLPVTANTGKFAYTISK